MAGFALVSLQPARADDDDWHSEAERPLVRSQQIDTDRDAAMPPVAAPPARETVYAPPHMAWPMPVVRYAADTSRRTADVDAANPAGDAAARRQ